MDNCLRIAAKGAMRRESRSMDGPWESMVVGSEMMRYEESCRHFIASRSMIIVTLIVELRNGDGGKITMNACWEFLSDSAFICTVCYRDPWGMNETKMEIE
jgi:hypothetical protein